MLEPSSSEDEDYDKKKNTENKSTIKKNIQNYNLSKPQRTQVIAQTSYSCHDILNKIKKQKIDEENENLSLNELSLNIADILKDAKNSNDIQNEVKNELKLELKNEQKIDLKSDTKLEYKNNEIKVESKFDQKIEDSSNCLDNKCLEEIDYENFIIKKPLKLPEDVENILENLQSKCIRRNNNLSKKIINKQNLNTHSTLTTTNSDTQVVNNKVISNNSVNNQLVKQYSLTQQAINVNKKLNVISNLSQKNKNQQNSDKTLPINLKTGSATASFLVKNRGFNSSYSKKNISKPLKKYFYENPFECLTLQNIKDNVINLAGTAFLNNVLTNVSTNKKEKNEGQTDNDRDEQEHKICLQLYVFVIKCISYPFIAKQATDMPKREFKVNELQLELIRTRINSLVKGEITISSVIENSKNKTSAYNNLFNKTSTNPSPNNLDSSSTTINDPFKHNVEEFVNKPICEKILLEILSEYNENFLQTDRLDMFIKSGAACAIDFKNIFRQFAENKIKDTELNSLAKDFLIDSWLMKFDLLLPIEDQNYIQHYGSFVYYFKGNKKFLNSNTKTNQIQQQHLQQQLLNSDVILTKEQIYDMYSRILSIKKFQHQILFNALQLDNCDEQAAAIRRELDGRLQKCNEMELAGKVMAKFVLKEMDSIYPNELRSIINQLMLHLESLPVSKGGSDNKYGLKKLKRYNQRNQSFALTKEQFNEELETILSKNDVSLTFKVDVVVVELKGLKSLKNKRDIYCTMELEGSEKLQTDLVPAQKPCWDTKAEFITHHPLPSLKIKLYSKSQKKILFEDKELAKVNIQPSLIVNKASDWYPMISYKNFADQNLELNVIISLEKPSNLKHCGYLYGQGKQQWKKWKKRFFVLVQVSQYTFAMCSFREKKSVPTDMLNLDGYAIDYVEPIPELADIGGKYFFNAVKASETVYFASDDQSECALWAMALYRATGQAHKPTLNSFNSNNYKENSASQNSFVQKNSTKSRKYGMEEYIQSDPGDFNHHLLFRVLQSLTLSFRLTEPVVSLGWLSPPQAFVLEEYSERYGVRSCFRQLYYLNELLDKAEKGYSIDPHLLNLYYSECSSFVHGLSKLPIKSNQAEVNDITTTELNTVTYEENELFLVVKDRLMSFVEYRLTNFRTCFPFGKPEGQFKATLTLLERLLMKDVTSLPSLEIRVHVTKYIETAALISYIDVSEKSQIIDSLNDESLPFEIKLNRMVHHAEICINVVKENFLYFSEPLAWFSDLLTIHCETFLSFLLIDIRTILNNLPPDNYDFFILFKILNKFLIKNSILSSGRFHCDFLLEFFPFIIEFVDVLDFKIGFAFKKNIEKEKWISNICANNQNSPLTTINKAVSTSLTRQNNSSFSSKSSTNTTETTNKKQLLNTCSSINELYWHLNLVKVFFLEINWPDFILKTNINKRFLKLFLDRITDAVKKVSFCFLNFKHKSLTAEVAARFSSPFEYNAPIENFIQMNIVYNSKVQSEKLFFDIKIDKSFEENCLNKNIDNVLTEMKKDLIIRLNSALESTLGKLSRYDDGSIIASMLSVANITLSMNETIRLYIDFLNNNTESLKKNLFDEFFLTDIYSYWYDSQINTIHRWIKERTILSPTQIFSLKLLTKIIYSTFKTLDVDDTVLESCKYKSLLERINVQTEADV